MKRRLLGLLLVLTLVLASAMPSMAETEQISDNQAIQTAWEKYVDLRTALEGNDVDAVKAAIEALEEANEGLDMDDTEVLVAQDPEFLKNLFDAAVIVEVDKLYDAFLADKNAKTAKDFVDYYGMEDLEEYKETVVKFIPDVETVYAEAQSMMPSENVIKVYDAYVELARVLESWSVDDGTREAVAAFDEVADIFNELNSEELDTLAQLMGEEDGPAAWNKVFGAVVDLNILIQMDDVYQAYINDPTEETAKAFVDYYDAVFPENPDDAMIDGELVHNFFLGIDDTYAEAQQLLTPEEGAEGEAETEDVPGAMEEDSETGIDDAERVSPEDLQKLADAYLGVKAALEKGSIDETTYETFNAMQDVLDIFNALGGADQEELAKLIGEESGMDAWNVVFSDWVDLNVLLTLDGLYQAFLQDPTYDNAAEFIGYYEALFPENPEEAQVSPELIRTFFADIDDVYLDAQIVLDPSKAEPEATEKEPPKVDEQPESENVPAAETNEEVEDGEKAPATGDATSLIPLTALAAAGAVLIALRRKTA